MKVRYMIVAVAGFALSGCAIFTADDGTQSQPSAQSIPKGNVFEVFFDPDRSDLSETAVGILHNVAENAKQTNVTGLKLSVHSTAAGWDADSQALSERRAEAIKAELIKSGVPEAKISTVDVRRAQLVPTDDGVREPQNRRTEITLY